MIGIGIEAPGERLGVEGALDLLEERRLAGDDAVDTPADAERELTDQNT